MMTSGIGVVSALNVLMALGGAAQVQVHFNFSGGAGFSVPTDAAGKNLNTGWNFDLTGGYNIAPRLSADGDFAYNYWNLNSAALAGFGESGGYNSIWSLSFNPVHRFAPKSRTDFYTTGGFGSYHRNLTLTRPAIENVLVCDPFWVLLSCGSRRDRGSRFLQHIQRRLNLGGGVEVRLGDRRTKVFSDGRYQRMFTTHGSDLTYVPVTFGLWW